MNSNSHLNGAYVATLSVALFAGYEIESGNEHGV
jgi:hypothetical protein